MSIQLSLTMNRRIPTWLCVVSILLGILSTSVLHAEGGAKSPEEVLIGVNLLPDGSFELPCPDHPPEKNWSYWTPHLLYGSGQLVLDKEVSLEGHNSIRSDDGGFTLQAMAGVPAREGDVFNASMYVLAEEGFRSYGYIRIAFRKIVEGELKIEEICSKPFRSLGTDWTKIELTAIAPKDTVAVKDLFLYCSESRPLSGKRCWLDAVSLIKLRPGEIKPPL